MKRSFSKVELNRMTSVQSQWPEDVRFLIPGVNDTWNLFQKYCKGKTVTGTNRKDARKELYDKYQIFLAEGGSPGSIVEDSHRFERIRLHETVCDIEF